MNDILVTNLCSQLVRQVRSLGNGNVPAAFLYYDDKLAQMGAWEILVRPVVPAEIQAA